MSNFLTNPFLEANITKKTNYSSCAAGYCSLLRNLNARWQQYILKNSNSNDVSKFATENLILRCQLQIRLQIDAPACQFFFLSIIIEKNVGKSIWKLDLNSN